ncbi:MAG: hypothetical protein JKY95_03120 [Planctomycetaceae bacterium]|nr:hypothetical protein [Planctomycetaceae bacterium]
MTRVHQTIKTNNALRAGFPVQRRWFAMGCVLASLVAGCTQGTGLGSMTSMMPGSGISGQSEPDIDYEAETAARKRNSKADPFDN